MSKQNAAIFILIKATTVYICFNDLDDPDHIKQEREAQEQIEEQFRLQKYSSKGNKDVLKRWTSSNESEQSTSSEDSGIVNNEDTIELRVEGGLECTEFGK